MKCRKMIAGNTARHCRQLGKVGLCFDAKMYEGRSNKIQTQQWREFQIIKLFSFQWEEFKFRKPKRGERDPEDEYNLAHAAETIGDYKLKNSADYKVPQHLRETKVKKYKQLLHTREKVCFSSL